MSQESHCLLSMSVSGTSSGTSGRPIWAPRGMFSSDDADAWMVVNFDSGLSNLAVVTFAIGWRTPFAQK